MLQKLKDLLALVQNNVDPVAAKLKLLLDVLRQILDLVPNALPATAASAIPAADAEAQAVGALTTAIFQLEAPAASKLGDGQIINALLPYLLALLKKWAGL